MRRRPAPSLKLLKETYLYSPRTGLFIFKHDSGTRGRKGYVAGAKRVDGYVGITLGDKIYLGHHLAWYYYYGTWPLRIDHWDRVKSNNRIKNLREASAKQNGTNSGGWSKDKRTHKLPKGVYLDKSKSRRPMAAIRINGKLKILGFYDTNEEASKAYKRASLKQHGKFSLFYKGA